MKTAIRLLTLLVVSSISYPAIATNTESTSAPSADEGMTAAWGTSHMTLDRKGRNLDRGYVLYMTSDQEPGIAFRCYSDKFYAIVSVKPVSFQELLSDRFRNPSEWSVEYRIDGDEPKVESWIWAFKGTVFMSRSRTSADNLFDAARRGATIDFQRKRGDPITIEVPPGDVDLFDSFIENCGLAQADL